MQRASRPGQLELIESLRRDLSMPHMRNSADWDRRTSREDDPAVELRRDIGRLRRCVAWRKPYEEMGSDAGALDLTRRPKIFVGKLAPYPSDELEAGLEHMRELVELGDGDAVRSFLEAFLPESNLDFQDSSPTRVLSGN